MRHLKRVVLLKVVAPAAGGPGGFTSLEDRMTKNFMSSILDELMGRNRNALPTEQPKQISWDDPEVS